MKEESKKPDVSAATSRLKITDTQDKIQIEFLIEDLMKQLIRDRISPIAACNGCNTCSASKSV